MSQLKDWTCLILIGTGWPPCRSEVRVQSRAVMNVTPWWVGRQLAAQLPLCLRGREEEAGSRSSAVRPCTWLPVISASKAGISNYPPEKQPNLAEQQSSVHQSHVCGSTLPAATILSISCDKNILTVCAKKHSLWCPPYKVFQFCRTFRLWPLPHKSTAGRRTAPSQTQTIKLCLMSTYDQSGVAHSLKGWFHGNTKVFLSAAMKWPLFALCEIFRHSGALLSPTRAPSGTWVMFTL